MLMQNSGGQTRCIMGNVEVAVRHVNKFFSASKSTGVQDFWFKMADDSLNSSVREPLTIETTTCRSTCTRPVNGTKIKFTFVSLVFQFSLIVLFMVLVDYGEQSLPSPVDQRPMAKSDKSAGNRDENERAFNDISIYYPSKCLRSCQAVFLFQVCFGAKDPDSIYPGSDQRSVLKIPRIG